MRTAETPYNGNHDSSKRRAKHRATTDNMPPKDGRDNE